MNPNRHHHPRRLVRVAVLDRQPAFRFGVDALLACEPDLAVVATAPDAGLLRHAMRRVDPDVVVVDHDPTRPDRLALCLHLRACWRGRIVLCTTGAGSDLTVAARLAGVQAVVDKAGDPAVLLGALRAAGARDARPLPVTLREQGAAAARLDAEDRALFAMRLAGTPLPEVALVLGTTPRAVEQRLAAVVVALAGAPLAVAEAA
jgi:DNA-binding NarL/FixJ family response regulator